MSFRAFETHIRAYELSGIDADARPPDALVAHVERAATVFASDAPRVTETLERLGLAADVVDPAFREAPPMAPNLPLLLPEIGWLALARARGEFSPALSEARADLVRRATSCARRLCVESESGDVALIGHGWFNRYVAAALTQTGWRKVEGPGFGKPWGFVSLRR